MIAKFAAHCRQVLSLSLAFVMLICVQSGVHAAQPKDIAYITRMFRAAVLTNTMDPLQAAIGEANAINCLDHPPSNLPDPSRDECIINNIPTAYVKPMLVVITLVAASHYYLPGAWFVRNLYPGNAPAEGSMTIDQNNVGTFTGGGGSATLIFSLYSDPSIDQTYIVFAYRTSQNDRGSGALLVSDDGCLMYGGYHSTSDSSKIGNFLAARC